MNIMISAAAGLAAGILSAWGTGGGTLLIIFMTACAGIHQQDAQGINLLYFIPVSLPALYSHTKNKLIEWQTVIPAMLTGILTASAASFAAMAVDTGCLKKIFGVFLIAVGLSELFRGEKRKK